MERLWRTERGAPLLLFAIPDEAARENRFARGIPYGASLILTHDPQGELRGLDEFVGAHPPVAPVFRAFRVMVGTGFAMPVVSWAGVWALRRRGWGPRADRPALAPAVRLDGTGRLGGHDRRLVRDRDRSPAVHRPRAAAGRRGGRRGAAGACRVHAHAVRRAGRRDPADRVPGGARRGAGGAVPAGGADAGRPGAAWRRLRLPRQGTGPVEAVAGPGVLRRQPARGRVAGLDAGPLRDRPRARRRADRVRGDNRGAAARRLCAARCLLAGGQDRGCAAGAGDRLGPARVAGGGGRHRRDLDRHAAGQRDGARALVHVAAGDPAGADPAGHRSRPAGGPRHARAGGRRHHLVLGAWATPCCRAGCSGAGPRRSTTREDGR